MVDTCPLSKQVVQRRIDQALIESETRNGVAVHDQGSLQSLVLRIRVDIRQARK
jgi:hypothetical protein